MKYIVVNFVMVMEYFLYTSTCQEAVGLISGAGVYGKLKFESGIHRVQVLKLL